MYASPHTAGHMQVHQHTIAMPNRHCVCCSASCGPGSCEASAEDADMLDKLGALRWPTRVPWLHRQKRRRAPNRLCNVRHSERRPSSKAIRGQRWGKALQDGMRDISQSGSKTRQTAIASFPPPRRYAPPPLGSPVFAVFWPACGFPGPCAPRACSLIPPLVASELVFYALTRSKRRRGRESKSKIQCHNIFLSKLFEFITEFLQTFQLISQ